MAYTLKTTGIATAATTVVAVDEDGTIKEFVNGWTPGSGLIKHANVTTGSDTFGSVGSKSYFQVTEDGTASEVPEAIAFTTNPVLWATRNDNEGIAWAMVTAGVTAASGNVLAHFHRESDATAGLSEIIRFTAAQKVEFFASSLARTTTSTTIPWDGTTKYTLGFNYMNNQNPDVGGDGGQFYYGVAGSAGALEPASPTGEGFWPNPATSGGMDLTGVTGTHQPDDCVTFSPNSPGVDGLTAKIFVWATFNRVLTSAEYDALHSDWFGTLFDAATTPTYPQNRGRLIGTGSIGQGNGFGYKRF